jgi:hypothetical protein
MIPPAIPPPRASKIAPAAAEQQADHRGDCEHCGDEQHQSAEHRRQSGRGLGLRSQPEPDHSKEHGEEPADHGRAETP